jgi:hypothetical protein
MEIRKPMLSWLLAGTVMVAALLWPALWNGFPIVYYDTGGYLSRPFEGTLMTGRSVFYGLFLVLGIPFNFWLNILIQAVVVTWMIALVLRVHGLGGRPWLTAALVIGLCVATGLPWYAAQLLPDILVPTTVIALGLLAFRREALRPWETWVLVAVIAAGIASHMGILALALSLVALVALLRPFAVRTRLPRPDLLRPAAAVVAGILIALFSNFAVTGKFAFTPGGFNFVFSRLVQDGIAARYLADRCPDPTLRLCAYRAELPRDADDWLWADESAIYKLGGFEQFEPEARRIAIESVPAYPFMHMKAAILATVHQFAGITTGDGIVPWAWHSQWNFERFAPDALRQYLASRQANGPIDFRWWNQLHAPVQALAIALLAAVFLLARDRHAAALAAFVFLALLANAAISGVLSNPHDRYQSRLAWIAPLTIAVAALTWRRPAK